MRIADLPASVEFDAAQVNIERIVPNVYLVDMLDYLDFITFDSGPGQCMLKEKTFYEFYDAGRRSPGLTITQKVGRLVDLLEDGDLRLIANRKKKMERIRRDFEAYSSTDGHVVGQGGLNLG